MAQHEIDAVDELERIHGERGPSEVGSQRRKSRPGAKAGIFLLFVIAVGVGGGLSVLALSKQEEKAAEAEQTRATVDRIIPPLKVAKPDPIPEPKPEPKPKQVVVVPDPKPEPKQANAHRAGEQEKDPIRERMLGSRMGVGISNTDATSAQAGPQPVAQGSPSGRISGSFGGGGGSGPSNELSNKLTPLKLSGSSAGILPDRDYLITQGTMLDCGLQTRLITTVPGMISCHLTRDVYSSNGRVKLLDRGSLVTGYYQGGITQGQARIFAQWGRVETPEGVVINIDSAGTGPLGEGGMGGWVDTHFWERFGGAIMVSVIGDLSNYLGQAAAENATGNKVRFDNTREGIESAAAEALKNTVNIPPTLYKNQGERVSIFITRDLDFRGVYELTTSN